jgi:hypothetical protein
VVAGREGDDLEVSGIKIGHLDRSLSTFGASIEKQRFLQRKRLMASKSLSQVDHRVCYHVARQVIQLSHDFPDHCDDLGVQVA